ncbi:MAG: hypothetical protein SFU87_11030 [Chitinophagaceae bacterium]|nr:hypothetical protein [Chitinophagaceae bacterium]
MKKLIIILCCSVFFITAEAQLLKKIKDKASKAVSGENKNETKSNDAGSSQNSSPANTTDNSDNTTPPPGSTKAFTLDAGETLMYDESEIIAENNNVGYRIITQNRKYEYFLIENGQKTGPFKQPPGRTRVSKDDESANESSFKTKSSGNGPDPVAAQYSKTIDGKLYIVFNAKNYGPYDFVSLMLASPDKKRFYAVVVSGSDNPMMAKMGMGNCYLINEAQLKQQIGKGMAMGMSLEASSNFKYCLAHVMDQQDQKIKAFTNNGNKQEYSMTEMYTSGNNMWLDNNGNIVTIPPQSPTQVMVNGKEVASFQVPVTNRNNLLLTPDPKYSVYYTEGKIYKADGSMEDASNILFPRLGVVNNKAAIFWLKAYKNESGGKDVYVCKKEL